MVIFFFKYWWTKNLKFFFGTFAFKIATINCFLEFLFALSQSEPSITNYIFVNYKNFY